MKYLVLAYGAQRDWDALSEGEQDALLAQDEVLRKRGDLVAAVEMAVTTLRAWDGTPSITDGAFAGSSAPLAGFGIVEAADLNEVTQLLAQTPCARAKGAVEMRPISAMNERGRDKNASDEAEIRALIEARANALRAKGLAGATGQTTADVVLFDVIDPLRYRGLDERKKRAADWFSSFDGSLGFEIHDLNIVIGCGVAFSHSLNRVNATRNDGQKLVMWWRSTVCYRKSTAAGW